MQTHHSAPELDLLTLYGSRAPSPCNVRPVGVSSTMVTSSSWSPTQGRAPAQGEAALREVIRVMRRGIAQHAHRACDILDGAMMCSSCSRILEWNPSIVARVSAPAGRRTRRPATARCFTRSIAGTRSMDRLAGTDHRSTGRTSAAPRPRYTARGCTSGITSAERSGGDRADLVFEAHVGAADAGDFTGSVRRLARHDAQRSGIRARSHGTAGAGPDAPRNVRR